MSETIIDYELVKRPSQEDGLTEEETAEYERCAFDQEYFMKTYVKVQDPSKGRVEFIPRGYQQDIMRLVDTNRFTIVNAPRQCGKSVTIAAILLHYAIFYKDMKIGINSNKLKGAKEIMARVKFAYEELPWWMKPAVLTYNTFGINFTNGSCIEAGATTSDGLRGMSFSIIYLDEFAHIKHNIAEDFWTSMLPTISASGEDATTKVIITSTPNGTEGVFANLWFAAEMGNNGFASYQVKPEQIPGRTEKFKKEMLGKMTLTKYLQEFEGAFLSSKATLINSMVIESIVPKEPIHEALDFKQFTSIAGRKLVMAVDVGAGIGADFHAVEIFDVDTLEQVGEYRNNVLGPTELAVTICKLIKKLWDEGAEDIYYSVENNSYGLGVIELLRNIDDEHKDRATMVHQYGSKLPGIRTDSKTKAKGAMRLKDLVETFRMKIYSRALLTEMKFFVKKGQSFSAESGMTDDLMMSCVVLCNMLEELSHHEEGLYETMNTFNVRMRNYEEEDSEEEPLPIVF